MVEVDLSIKTVIQLEMARELLRDAYAAADTLSDRDAYIRLVRATDEVNHAIKLIEKGN